MIKETSLGRWLLRTLANRLTGNWYVIRPYSSFMLSGWYVINQRTFTVESGHRRLDRACRHACIQANTQEAAKPLPDGVKAELRRRFLTPWRKSRLLSLPDYGSYLFPAFGRGGGTNPPLFVTREMEHTIPAGKLLSTWNQEPEMTEVLI